MAYIEIKFSCSEDVKELLIFDLNQFNEISFWEHEDGFSAYFALAEFENKDIPSHLNMLQKKFDGITFSKIDVPKINWNKEWESNYSPLKLADKYFIRAPFHEKQKDLINFTIMPNMAFGTGHHATTELIFTLIEMSDMKNKKVLDFGCGTGILSILAEHKDARQIIAIDIEEEAVEITAENAIINGCTKIEARLKSIEEIPESDFDCIIANINRNILLDQAKFIKQKLKAGGILFLSGFYTEDLELIQKQYASHNIIIEKKLEKKNWLGLACRKV